MGQFILRRLVQTFFTVLGVMLITFLLFRVVSGDIAASRLGEKATERRKAEYRRIYGYDRPEVFNLHRSLVILDKTAGEKPLGAKDVTGGNAAAALALFSHQATLTEEEMKELKSQPRADRLEGRSVFWLTRQTPIEKLSAYKPLSEQAPAPAKAPATPPATAPATGPSTSPATQAASVPATAPAVTPSTAATATAAATEPATSTAPAQEPRPVDPLMSAKYSPVIIFSLANGESIAVDLAGARTAGDVIDRINEKSGGKIEASISSWSPLQLFDSQFFHHLWTSATFQGRSLIDNKKLTTIMGEKAQYSLALQIPVLAIEWFVGLIIACYVAYYRGGLADRIGVFLSVLGMCIPFLAFLIIGQWIMFSVGTGEHAYGIYHIGNIYVPIAIAVIAGLGGQVRFYRTVILDETNRDYVRTARAKGVPLPSILFKHVLRNCMLPILTSLVMTIPFLMMGSLLIESMFGIPGLGDLMLTSIRNGNEPLVSGLVFLTALIYSLSILVTDVLYAVVDPRIRLK